jgi:hypothetical protein
MSTAEVYTKYRGDGETRQDRGIRLFEEGAFERVSRHVWIVENPKRPESPAHTVDLEAGTCSDCPDHEYHKHIDGFLCYHQIAVELYAAWIRKSARIIAPVFGGAA